VVRIGQELIESTRQANYVSLAGVASDPAEVAIPRGRYRVWATRGPEFSVGEAQLVVNAGETVTLEIDAPQRVVETPGWIAADLHVHAAPSFDSAIPIDERVAAFVAQGAEVLVASEHDRIYDYSAAPRRLGVLARDDPAALRSLEAARVHPFP